MYDSKTIVVEKEYVLKDVACYKYDCGRCGKVETIPQVIAKTFGKLAPEKWCCVAQDERRMYFCHGCSLEIGIGVN